MKTRLDVAMVARVLAETPEKAQALILAGDVTVKSRSARGRPTAGMPVNAEDQVSVRQGPRFVSRGGEKLTHALNAFGINPAGATVLDIGASTGGFTDCLLQAGAVRSYAVDVGRGQLHSRLRSEPRVVSMEQVNARGPFELPEKADLAVIDVSFISLRLVLPETFRHLKAGGRVVALLKPQFEAEHDEVGPKGVISDPVVHAAVIGRVVRWAVDRGIRIRGLTASPILGGDGNREIFLLLQPGHAGGVHDHPAK